MFSNNNKNRKCGQKCDVTATLLVFQKNGTAAVLVTTPVDGGRVSHDTCGSCGIALFFLTLSFAPTNSHRCWSRE